ncbi:MAG TPA: copper chaperone PCu(A)C [Steroidobacteraceae bacterium]|nr:copper chaperone PCu(A)C [Steroidobacteraceae bacterium]
MRSPLIRRVAGVSAAARPSARHSRGSARSPRRAALALALLAALVLPIAAPRLALAATAAHAETGVRITQAWIRWLPANLPAGGYLTLVNDSARTVTLVAVQSTAYASVALHRTLTNGGTARMVPVAAIAVPAHSTLDFASLGYHLMLMQARQSVQPGQHLPLTLQFADGGTLQISAQVKPPSAQPDSSSMKDMKDMKGMPGMSH